MVTIKDYAISNYKSAGDIDNFRRRYSEYSQDLGITVTIPSFEIYSLEKNYFYLYSNSDKIEFKDDWYMRPDYASYDNYNTVIYWPVLLYINNIDNIEDFKDLEEILIPDINALTKVIYDRVGVDDEYEPKDTSSNNEIRYYKLYPLDEQERERIAAADNLSNSITQTVTTECILKENDETFTLTSTNISNKYIDLELPPTNYSSINFYIGSYVTPQSYGYDYKLVYDSNNVLKRISWSSADCNLGNGLENILEANDVIRITYVYSEINCDTCPPYEDDILDGGVFGYIGE